MDKEFPYEDIVNLPHHVSERHRPMSMQSRAAQFAPFAALTGHEDAIDETARQTIARLDMTVEQLQILSQKLAYALSFAKRPTIEITYFVPDGRKRGGSYLTLNGTVKKIETHYNLLTLEDGREIPLDAISDISGEIFNDLDL